jgi:transcriptional regulator with XRE-family HTH domain
MPRRYSSLKAYRDALNISQAQAAARVPMAQGAWCRIERGEEVPRPELMLRLTELTGVPFEAFVQHSLARRRVRRRRA